MIMKFFVNEIVSMKDFAHPIIHDLPYSSASWEPVGNSCKCNNDGPLTDKKIRENLTSGSLQVTIGNAMTVFSALGLCATLCRHDWLARGCKIQSKKLQDIPLYQR